MGWRQPYSFLRHRVHYENVGLFVQLTFSGFFVAVTSIFDIRLPRHRPASLAEVLRTLPWKRRLLVLYASSALILVRRVFRVIDHLLGNAGYLLRREVFLYVFDAALMLVVLIIFNFVYPSEITEMYQLRVTPTKNEGYVEMQPRDGREVPEGPWS